MQDFLKDLGWGAEFLRQLDIDEISTAMPARVSAVHRDRVEVLGTEAESETGAVPAAVSLGLPPGLSAGEVAVGDWVLVDRDQARVGRVLERRSVIQRRAAGETAREQLIAANVDTLFIVTSANADFNPARLERYLALTISGGVTPVFVLTKADLADPDPYLDQLREVARDVPALALDARDPDAVQRLTDWCGPGQTVALVGSSGVGKSTLAVSLTGDAIVTQDIRADDAKGRHTTTARSFHRVIHGGWLIDTPGMRELRLAGAEAGIDAVFDDIAALAETCRFNDCAHETEPGCAVQAAIAEGELDPARLARWQKLLREDRYNSETLAEAHARFRAFGKMVKHAKQVKDKRR